MAFGIDDAVAGISGLVNGIIGRIWPDATEVEKDKFRQFEDLLNAQMQPILAQLDINKAEAASGKWFEADWRPAIGWIGALGLFWNFVFLPFVKMICGLVHYVPEPGTLSLLDLSGLMPIILAMLGIGASMYHMKENK